MSLQQRITEDMKAAMRAKDSARLTTIRMLTAALKQKEVDERVTLTDTDVLAIVDKLVKQRRDSVAAFEKADRKDLVDKEQAEIEILSAYLPKATDQWPGPALRLFAGKASREDVVKALDAMTGKDAAAARCDGYYFLGMYDLIKGGSQAAAQAKADFNQVLATGLDTRIEFRRAGWELERLGK